MKRREVESNQIRSINELQSTSIPVDRASKLSNKQTNLVDAVATLGLDVLLDIDGIGADLGIDEVLFPGTPVVLARALALSLVRCAVALRREAGIERRRNHKNGSRE